MPSASSDSSARQLVRAVLWRRLDVAGLERMLDEACARTGRSRSDVIRDALRRQLALMHFEHLRRKVMPFAEARGYLTDDDIFRDVS